MRVLSSDVDNRECGGHPELSLGMEVWGRGSNYLDSGPWCVHAVVS